MDQEGLLVIPEFNNEKKYLNALCLTLKYRNDKMIKNKIDRCVKSKQDY